MVKHKHRNQKKQPQGSDASPNNIPQSSTPTSEQQAEMSQKAYRQPLQSLSQQQHHGPGSSTPHPSFQESSKQSVSIHQQSALPEPPVNDHNSLIKLVSDLYWSTIGVLPPQHRPNQDSILRTLKTWAHLYVPTGPDLSIRTQVIAKLQEEMAIGKVADVVYILGSFSPFSFVRPQADQTVEINNHRNKQRNQQTQDLLKRAALVLAMPTVAHKLTAMNNPYLTE
jgi:hypothetical protein